MEVGLCTQPLEAMPFSGSENAQPPPRRCIRKNSRRMHNFQRSHNVIFPTQVRGRARSVLEANQVQRTRVWLNVQRISVFGKHV